MSNRYIKIRLGCMHFICIFYKLIRLIRTFVLSHLAIRVKLCPNVRYKKRCRHSKTQ